MGPDSEQEAGNEVRLVYIAVLICFLSSDLTDQSSFERAKFLVNELKPIKEVGTAAL